MTDDAPTTTPASSAPRHHRHAGVLWLVGGISVITVVMLAWPAWQRSRDLQRLEQAGAVFDTRTQTPSWMKLQGTTFDSATIESLARITTLEDLVLDESNVTDADLAALSTLIDLKRLSLSRTAITDTGLTQLAILPRLTTLVLNSSYHVTDEGLETLAQLRSLEEISLLDTTVTLPGLIELSGQHTTLQINSSHGVLGNRKLALSGTEITDGGLLRLHNARGLRGLELPRRITDRGFRHLHGLADLKFLVATGTAITDQGLEDLLAHSPPLSEIDFSGCSQLTDSGLARLATLPHLTQLKVDQTDAGPQLLSALSQSPRLELLSLDGCRGVDDQALARLLARLPRPTLKFLRLSGTDVTDASLQSFERGQLPDLEGLDLRGTRVTPDGIIQLRRRLTGCRVLD